jgi:hypothetical protein
MLDDAKYVLGYLGVKYRIDKTESLVYGPRTGCTYCFTEAISLHVRNPFEAYCHLLTGDQDGIQWAYVR